jgi:hypothetical protein
MRLEPFVRVDATPFSASVADVIAGHGEPLRRGRNNVDLNELDYGEVVFRFQDNGRLEEVTLQAPVLHLGALAVPFAALDAFVREHDPQVFTRGGFVVSPRFGLAFVPSQPSWVTALAAHALPQWEALRVSL